MTSNSSGVFIKTQIFAWFPSSHPTETLIQQVLWGIRIYISVSNKFQNDTYAAGQETTLPEPLIFMTKELWKNSVKIKTHHVMYHI
jgi:hypothetical protein